MRRLFSIVGLSVALGISLAGCEKSQVVNYKQGKYQGKADGLPWDNPRFNADRTAWEKAIRDRNQGQNDYRRID